jgi:hypothetical protein
MESLIELEENEFILNKTLSLENKLLYEFKKAEKVKFKKE